MTIIPLNDRLLVSPRPRDEATAGGVILPETVRHDDIDEGFVLDPGSTPLEVDDRVVYTKHAGSEITVENKKLLLIPHKNILAVYRDE
jgi:chaperonin GroES